MMTLREAAEIVNARKEAVLTENSSTVELGEITWQRAASPDQDKAILSGYDLDYDELVELLNGMSTVFCEVACHAGLFESFKAAIAEGLQIGLVKGADSRS